MGLVVPYQIKGDFAEGYLAKSLEQAGRNTTIQNIKIFDKVDEMLHLFVTPVFIGLSRNSLQKNLAHPAGFEPATNGLEIHCSIP